MQCDEFDLVIVIFLDIKTHTKWPEKSTTSEAMFDYESDMKNL